MYLSICNSGVEWEVGILAIGIAEELFKRLKLDIEIMIYPYKRCLKQMETGERDLILVAKKTEERLIYHNCNTDFILDTAHYRCVFALPSANFLSKLH